MQSAMQIIKNAGLYELVRPWPDPFSIGYISIPNYKSILSNRTLKLSNKVVVKFY